MLSVSAKLRFFLYGYPTDIRKSFEGLGGALSGVTYTSLYGYFQNIAHPEYIWYSLAAHFVIGIIVIFIFTKMLGEFKELDE